MNKQKKILNDLAAAHGISIGQAEEIWNLMIDKVATTISEQDKRNEDGLYEIEKFPVVHIDNFGKFIPSARNINYANRFLEKKKEDD
jgi:nucleoid DNA-binding protein